MRRGRDPAARLAGGLALAAALALGAGPAASSVHAGDALDGALAAEAARVAVIARIQPAVAAVFRANGAGGGSGVLISPDGYCLTNHHVTGKEKEMRVGLPDGRLRRATVVGVDPLGDIALLRVLDDAPLPFVELGDSDALRVGDRAIAMGNPFLLATDFRPTVTLGIVSGVHRYQPGQAQNRLVYPDCIQVDTPINPGNSGGPLFDAAGRLVGINGRISVGPRGRNNVGVGFAVSVNEIKNFLPGLRAGRWVDHGTLDATVRDEEDAAGARRTIFDRMYEDSVAYLAGIRLGDELVSFDGAPVRGANDFLNRITVLPAGWEVEVVVRRAPGKEGGEPETLAFRIRLAAIPTATATERKEHVPDPEQVRRETERLLRRNLARWGPAETETMTAEGLEVERRGTALVRRREGRIESVGDGEATVRTGADPGPPLPLDEAIAERLRRDAALSAALASDRPETIEAAQLVGGDRVEGRVADVIEGRIGETPVRLAFDAETGDLLRVEEGAPTAGGTATLLYSDHRAVEGGVRPFRIRVLLGDRFVSDLRITGWRLGREEDGAPPAPVKDAAAAKEENAVTRAAEAVFPAIVRLHGASGFARIPSYGTATIVRPDGIALTARSVLLQTGSLRAVLHDGTVRGATVVARDDDREMVAIRIEGPGPFPCLRPVEPGSARVGQWALSVGNAFRLAEGKERPSVNLGLLSAITRLDLRLGSSEFPDRGRIYLTDANVNPGSPGGALVDLEGRLVGILGRIVESRATRTYVSYAVPIEDLAPLVERAVRGEAAAAPEAEGRPGRHGIRLVRLALHLSPPAYVEGVDAGSPAERAGLRRDDLILRVGETTVPTVRDFRREMASRHAGDEVVLTVKRREEVLKVTLVLDEATGTEEGR